MDIFFNIFKHSLWFLSITFFWRFIITKWYLKMKFTFIYPLLLVQSFLKNVIFLCQNEVWNSTLNTISTFWQWAVLLSSSNYSISFEGSWQTVDFIIETTTLSFILTKCEWRNSFVLLSLDCTMNFLTNIFLFFLQLSHLILVEFVKIPKS